MLKTSNQAKRGCCRWKKWDR